MATENKTKWACISDATSLYDRMMRKMHKLQSEFRFTLDEKETEEAKTVYRYNLPDITASEARQDALNYYNTLVEATSVLSVFITNTGDDDDMAKLDDIDTIYLTSK